MIAGTGLSQFFPWTCASWSIRHPPLPNGEIFWHLFNAHRPQGFDQKDDVGRFSKSEIRLPRVGCVYRGLIFYSVEDTADAGEHATVPNKVIKSFAHIPDITSLTRKQSCSRNGVLTASHSSECSTLSRFPWAGDNSPGVGQQMPQYQRTKGMWLSSQAGKKKERRKVW